MALYSSFMPKTTMVQMFPTNSKPCILQNKNVAIIRCAVKKPVITRPGKPPQINLVLQATDRSLSTDQMVGLRRSNNGEDGQANAGNNVVDDVSNTTKIADSTDLLVH